MNAFILKNTRINLLTLARICIGIFFPVAVWVKSEFFRRIKGETECTCYDNERFIFITYR